MVMRKGRGSIVNVRSIFYRKKAKDEIPFLNRKPVSAGKETPGNEGIIVEAF